jgi:hypothetical protein
VNVGLSREHPKEFERNACLSSKQGSKNNNTLLNSAAEPQLEKLWISLKD